MSSPRAYENEWTAKDFAVNMEAAETAEMICRYEDSLESLAMRPSSSASTTDPAAADDKMSEDKMSLLNAYHQTFNDDSANCVDHKLVVALIKHLLLLQNNQDQQAGSREGAILVFLTGYEDIVTIK